MSELYHSAIWIVLTGVACQRLIECREDRAQIVSHGSEDRFALAQSRLADADRYPSVSATHR